MNIFRRLFEEMQEIILQNKAQEALDYLYKYEKDDFESIVSVLQELKQY